MFLSAMVKWTILDDGNNIQSPAIEVTGFGASNDSWYEPWEELNNYKGAANAVLDRPDTYIHPPPSTTHM